MVLIRDVSSLLLLILGVICCICAVVGSLWTSQHGLPRRSSTGLQEDTSLGRGLGSIDNYQSTVFQTRQIEYRSRSCTCAYFTRCLLTLITVLLPIPIIFASQGLWKKFGDYIEQPRLQFNYRYLVLIESERGVRYATTLYNLESIPAFLPSSVSSQNLDHNGDGRPDEITLLISVPTNITYPSTLSLFLFFDTLLDYHDIIQTETVLHHRLPLSSPHSLFISSPVTLHQLAPLNPSMRFPRLLINDSDPSRMRSFPRDLMQVIANRPLGLRLERPIITPLSTTVLPNQFSIKLALTVPASRIAYQTRFFELIKWAWIQYLAIAVIIYWACEWIAAYLFENRLINAVIYRID
ncbi:tmem-231 [Pristionchus pacificus]|uniref:Transmembrane protein 231 n=1 Tax=Pristionchus pacificus TaxID=54126 RepID=A0A2A6BH89_PRIPA|nr:tmem-231 [Pristionchus pacificus]|eukprot:PDM65285.1 hypothetical protein PRIPAC_52227 [Pristionchus pacificus]